MAIQAAHRGGSAVRWTYGAFLALFVALAVLVHHETAATGASRMMSASSMAVMDGAPMQGAAHAGHTMPGEATPTAWEPSSSHSMDAGGCAAPDMQHCTTASIGSVQLVAPAENEFSPLTDLPEAVAASVPVGTVGRAPPDLSVLSLLRI
ncbi:MULTISPECIES: DUF6153 family protein [Streptomyces]|uniref:DUF6153 family protein n=1 Tax=Streptomyces tricolor TaxID=68277 RepID=A0ABS9J9C3_9ACTN|nr:MULTISPECIES: DUF6153 family protein [Streptomyces]MCG0062178.1 DUF6153 family protein [Streptomyces tricolor]